MDPQLLGLGYVVQTHHEVAPQDCLCYFVFCKSLSVFLTSASHLLLFSSLLLSAAQLTADACLVFLEGSPWFKVR